MKQPKLKAISKSEEPSIQFTESDYEQLREAALALSALTGMINKLPADDEISAVQSFATKRIRTSGSSIRKLRNR